MAFRKTNKFFARRKGDGKRRQRAGSGDALQVDKRDNSKQIKKGGRGAPRKISIEKLRQEGGRSNAKGGAGDKKTLVVVKKGGKGGADQQGGDRKQKKTLGRRPAKGGKRSGKVLPKDPAAKRDALDKDLESYWMKGGHKELGKSPHFEFRY